jgi:hypothetical protein
VEDKRGSLEHLAKIAERGVRLWLYVLVALVVSGVLYFVGETCPALLVFGLAAGWALGMRQTVDVARESRDSVQALMDVAYGEADDA